MLIRPGAIRGLYGIEDRFKTINRNKNVNGNQIFSFLKTDNG